MSLVLATALLTRDARSGASRLSAALLTGGAVWAGCEVAWNSAADPETALFFVRLAALGWVATGTLGLHLILEVVGEPAPKLRRTLPILYLISLGFLVLNWTTPLIQSGVVRTKWGWGYELGPAYPFFIAFATANWLVGIFISARAHRNFQSDAERKQAAWITMGFLTLLTAGSITDGILPYLGIQVIHLATPSFVVLGLTVMWSMHRYGYTLLLPEAHSREIVETISDGLVMLRLDGRIRTANTALAELVGCSPKALVGVQIQTLLDSTPSVAMDAQKQFDCELRPMVGPSFPVHVSTGILRNGQRDPCGMTMLVRDQREVESLRKRLLLTGRMAAVGQLAAGIAHEINNPVAYVRANLVMLRQHWENLNDSLEVDLAKMAPEDLEKVSEEQKQILHESQDLIDESLEGVARTAAIVLGIREFSHAGSGRREPTQLNDIVDAARRMASPHVDHVANVDVHYGVLPLVLCSAHEIQQVVVNLLLNAADAAGERGTIQIQTLHDENHVRLLISDDGSGIDSDTLDRIFDPFYTTKDVGEGTGLGLSISYEIVSRHDGQITVESEFGQGTTFCVQLPIDPEASH